MPARLLLVSGALVVLASGFLALALAACDEAPSTGAGGHGGAGGSGGGCPVGLQAMFTISITALDGPVPPDTSLEVTWSAGPEPIFELDEPTTWKSLEEGTNVICDVNHEKPPPEDLVELICRLWTSGATEVVILADRYQKHTQTLIPLMSDQCEGPLPTAVAIQLIPDADAGPSDGGQ